MKKVLIPALMAFTIIATSCNDEKKIDETAVTTETEQTGVKTDAANTGNDTDFAMKVADGNMMEIKLGQLAQTQGSAAKVKEFGKMMETDHSKSNDELIVWAMKNNVSLPSAMSAEKQGKYDELAGKKGADFDKAYTAFMVEAHEKNIAAFKSEADGGSNAELKSWAGAKLPTLEHHLEMAKSNNAAVKNK